MTIGLLEQGQQHTFGYGRLSQSDLRVPDGDTIYEIGSASKVLTGLLLADAVVQGRVKLDQPAVELLPAGVKMPNGIGRAITLQDLSTHMSGLPTLPDNFKPANPLNPYADYTVDDLYSFLNGYKQTRSPGEKSEYSNLGMGLLGHLLALQAHSTYDQLLNDRIATPLKMASTRIKLDEHLQAKLAPGHLDGGRPTVNWDLPVLAGAGAIRSTANDMLRFADANLSPPKGKLGEAIELAWTIHQQPLPTGGPTMGLSWHVTPDGTHWHNGQTGGYHSMILINRKYKTAVVLLTNSANLEVDRLATDIIKMVSGTKVEPRQFEKTIKVPVEVLQKYVGSFELAPGVEFTVTAEGDKLMVSLTGQQPLQIFPRSETLWFYKFIDATITFSRDKSGECNSLELFQNGKKLTAKRTKKSIKGPAKNLQKFVGRYELLPEIEFEVTADDDKLMVSLTGQPTIEISPRTETAWFYKVVDATITFTFNVDKSGECNSLEFSQLGKNQTARRIKKTIKVPAEDLQKFVGKYELAPGIEFEVTAEDERLMVGLTGQSTFEIFPRSETTWFYKVVDATITFKLDQSGECKSLELFQLGKKKTAKRIN